jgi:hypothetical protein
MGRSASQRSTLDPETTEPFRHLTHAGPGMSRWPAGKGFVHTDPPEMLASVAFRSEGPLGSTPQPIRCDTYK